MPEDKTEVLVVGAGPVGLLTALLLAKGGVEVTIIDREERTAARSYACALHPRTLRLLAGLGLATAVLDQGRRIETVGFYETDSRRALIKLSDLGGEYPFLLILPQNVLEELLEGKLREAGVAVHWNHRFDTLEPEAEAVVVTIEKLGGTAAGYIVPHWETVVKSSRPLRAQFLVGADGANSMVRSRLAIEYERAESLQHFAAYEFESDQKAENEVKVVLDAATTNVLWPLTGNKYRWTFQLLKSEVASDFPEKERRAARFAPSTVDEKIRQYVQKVARHRAPWFSAEVKAITWCTDVGFDHRVVKHFGRDRCWLVGDAAHQTGPVGAQSMNVGMGEAETLAANLQKVLREQVPLDTLEIYNRDCQAEWRRLLGFNGGLRPSGETSAWVRENRGRILPCIPGSGDELGRLARQLSLSF